MWGDSEHALGRLPEETGVAGLETTSLIEAAGGRVRTAKGRQTDEESDWSWMTQKRTVNGLLAAHELAELSRKIRRSITTVSAVQR